MTKKSKNIILILTTITLIVSIVLTVYFARKDNHIINIKNTSIHQIQEKTKKSNHEKEEIIKDDKITENTTDDTLNEATKQSEKSKKTPNYKNNKNNQKHNIKINKLNKTSDSFKIKYSIILMLECLLLGISTTLLIVNNYNKKKDSNK